MPIRLFMAFIVILFSASQVLASVPLPNNTTNNGTGSNPVAWQLTPLERAAYLNSVAGYLTPQQTAQVYDVFDLIGFNEHQINVSGYLNACEDLVVFWQGEDNVKSFWPNIRCEGGVLVILSGGNGRYFVTGSEKLFEADPTRFGFLDILIDTSQTL